MNTGTSQVCALSPMLYTLYTHDCVASRENITILKFADDTLVLGLINKNDESAYRKEEGGKSGATVSKQLDTQCQQQRT